MRHTFRRIGALAVSAVVAGAFVAGPAGATTPETYLGNATATALDLNVLGQSLTLGYSKAEANSLLKAVAEAAGQLLQPESTAKAQASGDNQSAKDTDKCATPALPEQLAAILDLSAGCASSITEITNGVPHALAEGTVANIGVSANAVLDAVPQLNQTIDQVQDALTPVLGNLDTVTSQLGLSLSDTVGQLIDAVQTTQTLAVQLGKSTSDVVTNGNVVTSTASAAGGKIDLLPIGGLGGGPLASIEIGSAKATSVYDRTSGKSTPTFDPAIVRVKLGLPALGTVQEIPVAPGQSITLFQGLPLESDIIVGNGSTVTNPDGSVGAVADGVTLNLLKGINGGVRLALATAKAGVAGNPAVATLDVPRELPRTGGTPWLPVAGATFVVAAVLTRRFLVSTR